MFRNVCAWLRCRRRGRRSRCTHDVDSVAIKRHNQMNVSHYALCCTVLWMCVSQYIRLQSAPHRVLRFQAKKKWNNSTMSSMVDLIKINYRRFCSFFLDEWWIFYRVNVSTMTQFERLIYLIENFTSFSFLWWKCFLIGNKIVVLFFFFSGFYCLGDALSQLNKFQKTLYLINWTIINFN